MYQQILIYTVRHGISHGVKGYISWKQCSEEPTSVNVSVYTRDTLWAHLSHPPSSPSLVSHFVEDVRPDSSYSPHPGPAAPSLMVVHILPHLHLDWLSSHHLLHLLLSHSNKHTFILCQRTKMKKQVTTCFNFPTCIINPLLHKYAFTAWLNSVDPDQPAHLWHLIRLYTVPFKIH
jgi:hypothetical protein